MEHPILREWVLFYLEKFDNEAIIEMYVSYFMLVFGRHVQ